jgi:hypothetical protein
VQSLVGILPILPAGAVPWSQVEKMARLRKRFARLLEQRDRRDLADWRVAGEGNAKHLLISVVSLEQLPRLFSELFDEDAFLSPYGLRSLSKRHQQPYAVPGMPDAVIEYEPAESKTAMYGGNSNWRGPVWFPTNCLVIRALLQYAQFFGPDHTVEYPAGSGKQLTLREIADDIGDRLVSLWLPDANGRRPVFGATELFQTDPAWKDNLLFFEYFHGDNGAGLGASHQTGWTALVADLILDPPRTSKLLADFAP